MKASTSMLVFALLVSCGYSYHIARSDGKKFLRGWEQLSMVPDSFIDNQEQDSSKNDNVLLKTMKFRWTSHDDASEMRLTGDLSNVKVMNAKEGSEFQLEFDFQVTDKAVHDLQLGCVLSRKNTNINFDYWYEMMGTYEPQLNAYNFIGANRVIYKGMWLRGSYIITCRITDADSYEYLKWQFEMKIAKARQ
jgi:hypothetical protein